MKKESNELHCIKCKHDWKQRGKKKPKYCPCCHNPNWNKRDAGDFADLILG